MASLDRGGRAGRAGGVDRRRWGEGAGWWWFGFAGWFAVAGGGDGLRKRNEDSCFGQMAPPSDPMDAILPSSWPLSHLLQHEMQVPLKDRLSEAVARGMV